MSSRARAILALSLLVSLTLPVVLSGGGALDAMAALSGTSILAMLVATAVVWWLNVIRCRWLLLPYAPGLGYLPALRLYLMVEFASKTTPLGSGAPVIAMMLLRQMGIDASAGLAIFAMTGILDLLALLLIAMSLAIYGVSSYLDISPATQLFFQALALLIAFGFLYVFLQYCARILSGLNRMLFALGLKKSFRLGVMRFLVRLRRALMQSMALSPAVLLSLALLSVAYWLVYLSILYMAVGFLGAEIDWGFAIVSQLVAMTAGHLVVIPGGAGSIEAAAAIFLTPVLGPSLAASAILVWRFMTFYLVLLGGGGAALLHSWCRRRTAGVPDIQKQRRN